MSAGTSAHNRGIVTPRRVATIGNKLRWGRMHPVGQRRQSGADEDDQDDKQNSAHNQLFERRSINREERCEVPQPSFVHLWPGRT